MTISQRAPRLDVEFSLALNNRTGKYFVCRDLMAETGDLIGDVWYWRIRRPTAPTGAQARVLGRLMTMEFQARSRRATFEVLVPRIARPRPILFTDPLQVLFHRLKRNDIVLCHDVGPITHPHLYDEGVGRAYRLAYNEVRDAAPHMLFVSRDGRAEFERLYGRNYPALAVIPPPIRSAAVEGEIWPVEGVRPPFLLTVGAVGARKNQAASIRAFAQSGLAERGFSYVICGGPEPGYEAVAQAARETSQVVLTGYADEAQLRWLYRNATGFVLASVLEGFGVPAVEAIAQGLTLAVTRSGALREVAGPAAFAIDPTDPSSIAGGMVALADQGHDERRSRLAALKAHIAAFSPEAAAAGWRGLVCEALGAG